MPPITAKMPHESQLISTFTERALRYCGNKMGQIVQFAKRCWKYDSLLDFEKDVFVAVPV